MKSNPHPLWNCPGPAGLALVALFALISSPAGTAVTVSEQDIVIPTYAAGAPEPNPMFFFGKASQGAEGRVYPYPLYDKLTHEKENKTYRIVYLENEYIRVGVLPEVGGRIFEGVDKSNGYDFFYRQHVIKPALIGLIGAWISGGVEWNIPHHHRASTFIPVQYRIEAGPDGSRTVWVGELEVRHQMRWAVGYTLRPGKSYLEAALRIVNRTPVVNSMLCFANVAVHANENYQVIFPPSTQIVTHHSKREFTTWPIATGRYGGYDFGRGTDVSWYTNHISANSMFAWNYSDDFFAGYDHGRQAGLMSVADHHVVPGKKLWTWGNGPRGRMWEKILTDNDGPYIELMVGGYSDNQPDYSWLQPYEVKSFSMYWYPFREIGGVKKATLDAAVNLEIANGKARLGFCTTSPHESATVRLKIGEMLLEEPITINPAKPFLKTVDLPAGADPSQVTASLWAGGRELVAYTPLRLQPPAMPEAVTPPPAPADIKTVEELYLAGLRIEQFHHPTLEPEPYWQEALKRDPGDTRVNTALGIHYLKKARFAEAEQLFRKAIERLAAKYTTPQNSEPFYYLGLALQAQGKNEAACTALYQATWGEAWRAPAYFSLAELASLCGDRTAALDLVDRSLQANAWNPRALNLKAAILRHLEHAKEALAVLEFAAQKADPLDVRLMAERWLAGDEKALGDLNVALGQHPHTGLATAAEYGNAGLWRDGVALLTRMVEAAPDKNRVSALAWYYLGHFAEKLGQQARAAEYRQLARQMSPDYVFPFQWEVIPVLRRAMEVNPQDARAPYYLGNLLYDWQPEEAVKLWEQAVALDTSLPVARRNLAVACQHGKHTNRLEQAIRHLEQAVAAPDKYALHFAELDELYATSGAPPEKRLALLEQNHSVAAKRDDALAREIGLKVFAGKADEAIRLMTGRHFSVWEGGTLDVAEHWVNAQIVRGHQQRIARQFAAALAAYQAAKTVPENLPSERALSGRNAEIAYYTGLAYEGMGEQAKARQAWQEATRGGGGPGRGRGGGPGRLSEQQVQACFQAMARWKLGETAPAETAFRGLLESASRGADAGAERPDFFQSFGERQSQRGRAALAHYVAGLAHLGLGEGGKATEEFNLALKAAPDHLGAKAALVELSAAQR